MTNQQHPITPPPELVQQWCHKWTAANGDFGLYLATQAACWGADQELEACVKWAANTFPLGTAKNLRTARRPKPPSLAEQALTSLSHLKIDLRQFGLGSGSNDIHTIRAALERLQELEKGNE